MKPAHRNVLRLTLFDCLQLFARGRWALAFLIIVLIAYLEVGRIMAHVAKSGIEANVWDALFAVFGNQSYIMLLLTPLALYLTSDIVMNRGFGATLFLKVESRQEWWYSKTLTLSTTIGAILIGAVVVTATIASFALVVNLGWSPAAIKASKDFYINPGTLSMPPYFAFTLLLSLLGLGWLAIGLLSMAVAAKTGRHIFGLMLGLLVHFISFAAWKIIQDQPFSYVLIPNHLLFSLHALGNSTLFSMPLSFSFIFWFMFTAIVFALGYRHSLNKDYF